MRTLCVLVACLFLSVPASAGFDTCVRLGDVNGDGSVCGTTTDIIVLANWLFTGGPQPPCLAACDVSGNGIIDATDVSVLTDICFRGLGMPENFGECVETDSPLSCDVPCDSFCAF